MKQLISIMDMRKKKAGIAFICITIMFVLGSVVMLAADTSPQMMKEVIKEKTMISVAFLPDPTIYEQYSKYGITISEDCKMLMFNGQQVRLFVDESIDIEAFFLDEKGILDLAVIRNDADEITGIEKITEKEAQAYRSAFFAKDMDNLVNSDGKVIAIKNITKE